MLTFSGHAIDGEADDGSPLADISADRILLGLEYEAEGWDARLRWQHRFSKDDPGSGEVAVDAVELVSASFGYQLTPALRLVVRGTNLLDETYLASADDLASAAPGRSLGLGLTWTR
jgi:outer membrane receptor protein involved in Fe transport